MRTLTEKAAKLTRLVKCSVQLVFRHANKKVASVLAAEHAMQVSSYTESLTDFLA